ncbi:putative amidohydrolase [Caldalkalibacillus uzonensis]|uniref:Amidohydrolase n=1 Tax=Caldalkalibacillus uzonensis TaxID=353224 RepID=A0ABU0CWI0_9BACI|nr:carbon-nitrogen hydrolase family protein [Caldalkalibacillus uzonensis]MDQ0340766.1 putative amidohydrolase [Caldalkalibacillus uzonensis]
MQEKVKVAVVQTSGVGYENREENLLFTLNKIEELGGQGLDLIVFPELGLTGFVKEFTPEEKETYWREAAEPIPGPTTNRLAEAAKKYGISLVVGMAERAEVQGEIYNVAVLISKTGEVHVTRKVHLPQIEKFYFTPGPEPEVIETPFGKIGLVICYDVFFPEISRVLAAKGAEILVVIGSIWKGGKEGGVGDGENKRRIFQTAPLMRALENGCHVIFCNASGRHYMGKNVGYWSRFGESKVISALGEILAESTHDREDVLVTELNFKSILRARSIYPFFMDRKPSAFQSLTKN